MTTSSVLHSFAYRAAAQRQAFLRALEEGAVVQERLLLRILERNAATEFGQQHGLSKVRTIDDYRSAVPLRTYNDFSPWIERIVAGESNLLTTEEPSHFILSSGTTGRRKTIPISARRLGEELIPQWLIRMSTPLQLQSGLADRDDAVVNKTLAPPSLTSPASDSSKPKVVFPQLPWLAPESPLLGMPGTTAPWFPLLSSADSFADRMYYTLRMAVEHDVLAFLASSPLRLLSYARTLQSFSARIIEEVHNGTINQRAGLRAPNPQRARALEVMAARSGGLTPRDVWPRLALLSCWNPESATSFVKELLALFGNPQFLPGPYAASEAVIAVPLDLGNAAPLAIFNAFFEFIPEGEEGARTLLPAELTVGSTYEVVLTQSCGLYRYRLGDLVRVEGFIGSTPKVRFMSRQATFSFDYEKLTEHQVLQAGTAGLAKCGLAGAAFTCLPEYASPPRYVFVIEWREPLLLEHLDRLSEAIDRELRALNFVYDQVRNAGVIGSIAVEVVRSGSFLALQEGRSTASSVAQHLKESVLDTSGTVSLQALRQVRLHR